MCKDCFQDIFSHKFKSNMRTNLKIWKDDYNLICVSGGSNSMAMLDLIYWGLFGPSQKKMFFSIHVILVDETLVYGWSEAQREENISIVIKACEKYGFTYSIVPLETVYEIDEVQIFKEHSVETEAETENTVDK